MDGHNQSTPSTESLWTTKDAAAYFRVDMTTIRRRKRAGLLPFVQQPGTRSVRYRPSVMRDLARLFEGTPSSHQVLDAPRYRHGGDSERAGGVALGTGAAQPLTNHTQDTEVAK